LDVTQASNAKVVGLSRAGSVAVITIDSPPVNALSSAVMRGLAERLAEANADSEISAIVVSGAGNNFVAGADITRLQRIASGVPANELSSAGEPTLTELCARLENGPKPTVAAIDGFALGGGLEIALACNARVGTPGCRVGLPELGIGLIPGAGGTQRLPRLIGIERAAQMMLASEHVRASEAQKLGILDELSASAQNLLEHAAGVALAIADGKRERRRTLDRSDKIEQPEPARAIIERLSAEAKKKSRNVEYPGACLDAILTGAVDGPEAGLIRERQHFETLLRGEVARGLIHVFFAERAAAKVPDVSDQGLEPRPIRRVGVIGGGTMGSGIATALVSSGLEVLLSEATPELAEKAVGRVRTNVERNLEKGRITRAQADETLSRLRAQNGFGGFEALDMVIEAATENLELKQRLFAELESATRPECILATNTSTIDIDVVGKLTSAKERILGTHFFSPAHVMKLVEVVRTRSTSKQVLVDTLALSKRIKKTAVTVGNCTGFLVNRVFMPYGQTTGFLIDRGTDPYRIDKALYAFGMPMGPCRMGDLAGLDVSVFAGKIMDAAYPDRAYRSPLRALLVQAGRLGEKSGRGHYRYEGGKAVEDAELSELLIRAREAAGNPEPIQVSDDEIVALTLFGVVNEACRAIEEGIVVRASDIDVAVILGMGFPAYRGGPMKWADGRGAKHVYETLSRFYDRFGVGLFRPSEYLAKKAQSGESLLA
jgi:enoyl-CoA hydratase/3-hydroxyacyl-CoA dehydrogenase